MRFLLVSASGAMEPQMIEIDSLVELVRYLDYCGECNDLIISRRSLVDMAHDRKQDREKCRYVLCIYDDFIEPKDVKPRKRRK